MPNTQSNTVNHLAVAQVPATPPYRKARASFLMQFAFAWFVFVSTAFAQTTDPNSVFSDLDTQYDGGVANPTDGSTGNVLQQTLFAAYFWGQAHHAHATVVVASEYVISGSRILVPGNVDLVCSSYSPHTYGGGCVLYQTGQGDGTASGGSPILMLDSRFGVLADHKTLCSSSDNPPQPGCTIISSSGASIRGFTLSGDYQNGGADVGIRVYNSSSVHIEDTFETQFGGPGIAIYGGLNNSADWNFGTNVDLWWCYHPSQLTYSMGGVDFGTIDGEASHNQYSTGCAFAKSFTVALEYPHLAAMHVGGAGNLIDSNLLQVDGIGLIVDGFDERVINNRIEYLAREAVRNLSGNNTYANNRIISACLDPNLINLRPGSIDNGIPRYPTTPTFLHVGYMIMDSNGNIEQVVGNRGGTSDAEAPDWSVEPGGGTYGDELEWVNMGPWPTDNSPLSYWAQPTLVTGKCYGVYSKGGGGDTWSGNKVQQEAGVNGVSYMRGSYDLLDLGEAITGNGCNSDLPDVYGNGQCWWGGDLFSNGGPAYKAPNGMPVAASGGGTAWVGDYSVLVLTDNVQRHYNNFQGMAQGQTFSVTSSTVANVIDPWGITPTNWNLPGTGGIYGHPSLQTCTGRPLVVAPGSYYQFYYNLSSDDYSIRQINCPDGAAGGGSLVSIFPNSLDFGSQTDGTTSVAHTVTVTNPSPSAIGIVIAVSDEFEQTNNCDQKIITGASCTISITFIPTTTGAHIGALTITDNASGASQVVSLTGIGKEPTTTQPVTVGAITLSSSASNLEIVTSRSGKSLLTVTGDNDFAGVVNLKCEVVPLAQDTQIALPTCSLSPAQVSINSRTAGVSTLVISAQPSSVAVAAHRVIRYGGISLGWLTFVGLFPLCRLRRRAYAVSLGIMLVVVMTGCGYSPNSTSSAENYSGSYKVVITATGGAAASTSISIPVTVQQGQ
jgi:centrosomal CEP192-like protein